MTRDEALKLILENSREDYNNHSVVMPVEKVTELKNKIFDYFEKERVCKNCKWFEYADRPLFDDNLFGYCKNEKLWEGLYKRITVNDFGCNRFERIDK